jgi:transcriptional regulator with XRE-family HTH domain
VPKANQAPDPALGVVLRRLREQRGESLEAAAYRAGLTSSSLAAIELERSNPTWATVRAIAAALDVSLAKLGAAVEAQDSAAP